MKRVTEDRLDELVQKWRLMRSRSRDEYVSETICLFLQDLQEILEEDNEG
jgi:hypothetical protein